MPTGKLARHSRNQTPILIFTADFADSIWIKPKTRVIDGSDQLAAFFSSGLYLRSLRNLRLILFRSISSISTADVSDGRRL
jgi:hypothetical protein